MGLQNSNGSGKKNQAGPRGGRGLAQERVPGWGGRPGNGAKGGGKIIIKWPNLAGAGPKGGTTWARGGKGGFGFSAGEVGALPARPRALGAKKLGHKKKKRMGKKAKPVHKRHQGSDFFQGDVWGGLGTKISGAAVPNIRRRLVWGGGAAGAEKGTEKRFNQGQPGNKTSPGLGGAAPRGL